MSNQLVEKINVETEAKIKAIEAETDKKIEEIKTESEKQIADLVLLSQERVKKQKDQIERVATSRARQSGNIAVQTAKREVLDSLFDEMFSSLVKEPKDEYVKRYVTIGKETLPEVLKIVSVECPSGREGETNEILKELNFDSKIVINPSIKAGLIVIAEDGVFDLTLDRLFMERRPVLEMKVMETLKSS